MSTPTMVMAGLVAVIAVLLLKICLTPKQWKGDYLFKFAEGGRCEDHRQHRQVRLSDLAALILPHIPGFTTEVGLWLGKQKIPVYPYETTMSRGLFFWVKVLCVAFDTDRSDTLPGSLRIHIRYVSRDDPGFAIERNDTYELVRDEQVVLKIAPA